ncbi:hypothetical protein AGOR_G00143980 [Albula goreensis]|uniref:Uncharacterized protein n=1 Tax=Albula goreensis TaxID=1534307 RepID=A0A8T3D784_9TELE|nr:hypothetical protein AGOR_G00143980 [Albula goreensis]
MKETQNPRKHNPTGSRNTKSNPHYSAWEVSSAVDHSDEGEFHGIPKGKLVGKKKCESLDERNIVVSPHLLAQMSPAIEEVGQAPEEHLGRDLPEEVLQRVRSARGQQPSVQAPEEFRCRTVMRISRRDSGQTITAFQTTSGAHGAIAGACATLITGHLLPARSRSAALFQAHTSISGLEVAEMPASMIVLHPECS